MVSLFGYDILIESFVSGKLSAEEFDIAYTKKFLSGEDHICEELFFELDWFFGEVDAFTHDENLFPQDHVDERRLRESASKVLIDIRKL
jgi:hypothetical protein